MQYQICRRADPDPQGREGERPIYETTVCKTERLQGSLVFEVKWQGYENPKDRTWEPEENLYVRLSRSRLATS